MDENINITPEGGKDPENDLDETLRIFENIRHEKSAPVEETRETDAVSASAKEPVSQEVSAPKETDANVDLPPAVPAAKTRVDLDRVPPRAARLPQAPAEAPEAVSLDDFNRTAGGRGKIRTKEKKKRSHRLIKTVLYLAFVAVCCYLIVNTGWNVANDVFAFVGEDRAGHPIAAPVEEENVTVTVPSGADTSIIAKILKDAGVIRYPFVFEKYAAFRISRRSYLTGKYLTGDVTVNPMMNYDTLIDTLSDYERTRTGTVRITIPEGLTVKETLALLEENGVGKAEDYLAALNDFDYDDYRFMAVLTRDGLSAYRFDPAYSYRLEGYLFPDTYDFYLDENPVSAIDKFLQNFDRKFSDDFYDRCEALGLTVDQVITLASMIEKEGNNPVDYGLISSVFHNRLKNSANYPYLNSDATVQYASGVHTDAYEVDTSIDHPYNTYLYRGLPPGPICSPGYEAICAALWPENTSYYFFYTKKNGETVYARTYAEHQRNVASDN